MFTNRKQKGGKMEPEIVGKRIKKLMEIYNNNNQFKNRYRHSNDMEIIKKHLENEHKEVEKNSTNNDN